MQGLPSGQADGPRAKEFVDSYEKAYGEKPVNAAFYGYSVVTVLAKAIEAVGGDDPQAVARYIHSKPFDLPGGQLSFRADGSSTLGEWCGMTGFEKDEPTILDAVFFKPKYAACRRQHEVLDEVAISDLDDSSQKTLIWVNFLRNSGKGTIYGDTIYYFA